MRKLPRRGILVGVSANHSLVVWTFVAALLTACSANVSPAGSVSPGIATPTRDPAIVAYSTMVNTDTDFLDVQFYKKVSCKTRELCISQLQDTRVLAEALLRDVTYTPAPPALDQLGAAVKTAAQQFIDQLDIAILSIQQPDSDYVAASGVPDVHPLDLAAGGVICWPAKPHSVEGGESPSGYACG